MNKAKQERKQDVPSVDPSVPTLASELKELHSLHQSGVLTDEEYSQAKKKMLSNGSG